MLDVIGCILDIASLHKRQQYLNFFFIYTVQSASIFQFSLDPKVTRITPALCEFAKNIFCSIFF